MGAEKETSYLMPKSAFVKANMAYETNQITAYNDYCFCIKKRTLTPEVPCKCIALYVFQRTCKQTLPLTDFFLGNRREHVRGMDPTRGDQHRFRHMPFGVFDRGRISEWSAHDFGANSIGNACRDRRVVCQDWRNDLQIRG